MRKTKIATFGVLTAAAVAVPAGSAFAQEAQAADTHTHTLAHAGAAAPTQGAAGYEVQPGDTLSEVAGRHGTTWQNLAERNALDDPDRIYPGQHLELENASTPQPAPSVPPPAAEDSRPQADPQSQSPQAPQAQSAAPHQQAPHASRSKPQSSTAATGENAAKAEIIRRESSGNPNARNGKYYGLFQTDQSWGKGTVAQQHAGAERYVENRYGSWQAALAHHNKHGWY